jgi:dihydroxy-acid dehydratase
MLTATRCFVAANKYSAVITQRKTQGAGQAQLYATDVGKIKDGMSKAQVGISSVWYEGNPCNMHLLDVAAAAKSFVEASGMVGLRFNSIGVSDGISNGTGAAEGIERTQSPSQASPSLDAAWPIRCVITFTCVRIPPAADGMAYSLQSRDLIADGIETVMGAQFYDANISIPGCDKNMPGCLMAMARVNRPSVMVYGGTIRAGCRPEKNEKLDIISGVSRSAHVEPPLLHDCREALGQPSDAVLDSALQRRPRHARTSSSAPSASPPRSTCALATSAS